MAEKLFPFFVTFYNKLRIITYNQNIYYYGSYRKICQRNSRSN